MRTIIRVEHPNDGKGLFQAYMSERLERKYKIFNNLIDRHQKFPAPVSDSKIHRHIQPNEYCAFKSVEQLQQWINKREIKHLIHHGFRVLMLDVSEHVEGEYQILYKKENILQSKDITSLFQTD